MQIEQTPKMSIVISENTARYIARMIRHYMNGSLPIDATTGDADQFTLMAERYRSASRWEVGQETALADFILRVLKNGIPGGELIQPEEHVRRYLNAAELPMIIRPAPPDRNR